MKKAPERLRFAAIAIDIVTFGFIDGKLCVLVSPINRPPHYINLLGFLGGLVDPNESAEETCVRILKEKGNLTRVPIEQLYTFSNIERDKRNRVISIAYTGLVRPDIAKSYQHKEAFFIPVKKITSLAYDHKDMLQIAMKRLQGKLSYTTIIQHLLPRHFTLSELQSAYETILNKKLDKRNFRKKVLALKILKDTGNTQDGVKNRPAALYEFISSQTQELPAISF